MLHFILFSPWYYNFHMYSCIVYDFVRKCGCMWAIDNYFVMWWWYAGIGKRKCSIVAGSIGMLSSVSATDSLLMKMYDCRIRPICLSNEEFMAPLNDWIDRINKWWFTWRQQWISGTYGLVIRLYYWFVAKWASLNLILGIIFPAFLGFRHKI